ncbi:hypothetical protein CC79DRAFT_1323102 [Sarocladium strictum]
MAHFRRAAALVIAAKAVAVLAVAIPGKHNDTSQSSVSSSGPDSIKDTKSNSINITFTPSHTANTEDTSMRYDGSDNLHARNAPTIDYNRGDYSPWYSFDFLWSNANLHNSPAEAQGQKPKGGDVVWQFLSAKSDPPDPAVDMIRVAFHLPFKYGGPIEPVKGATFPPGFPGMPNLYNFGTEKVAMTRPGAFWTQKRPKQYTDDWSEYLNAEQELKKEKEIMELAEIVKQEKLKKKPTKSKWDAPSGKSSDQRAKRDHVDITWDEDGENDHLAARQEDEEEPYWTPPGAGHPPVSDVVDIEQVNYKIKSETNKPPKPKMDTPGTNQIQNGYPFFEDAVHSRIDNSSDIEHEKIIDFHKASGMNKPNKIDVSDWVPDDGLDDFGRTPYIKPAYPEGPEHPRPTRPKEEQPKFPHDPSRPPTHPPGTIKEQDDAIRRRLFQRTLNETEYEQRNWNWMRCVNRHPEARSMSLYLEAGGLWATENYIFRHAIERRATRDDCSFTGIDWKYWDQEAGWGDMTIKIDMRTHRHVMAPPKEGSCSFYEVVYKAAQDAMAQFNKAGDRRALYMHGCGGPYGKGDKSSTYDSLVVEIPNEVVYLDPPEKDLARFKDFEKYGVNVSPPFRSPLKSESKFVETGPI